MWPTEQTLNGCKSFDADIWSDLFKDAHGYRPRMDLSGYTAEMLDELWNYTCKALEEELEREKKAYQDAIDRFEADLRTYQEMAGSRADAFRWMMQAEELEEDMDEDPPYVAWKLNLPYDYVSKLKEMWRS